MTALAIAKRIALVAALHGAAVILAIGGLKIATVAPDFEQSFAVAAIGWGLFSVAMLLIVAAGFLATMRHEVK
jgi:hypothetical protein